MSCCCTHLQLCANNGSAASPRKSPLLTRQERLEAHGLGEEGASSFGLKAPRDPFGTALGSPGGSQAFGATRCGAGAELRARTELQLRAQRMRRSANTWAAAALELVVETGAHVLIKLQGGAQFCSQARHSHCTRLCACVWGRGRHFFSVPPVRMLMPADPPLRVSTWPDPLFGVNHDDRHQIGAGRQGFPCWRTRWARQMECAANARWNTRKQRDPWTEQTCAETLTQCDLLTSTVLNLAY